MILRFSPATMLRARSLSLSKARASIVEYSDQSSKWSARSGLVCYISLNQRHITCPSTQIDHQPPKSDECHFSAPALLTLLIWNESCPRHFVQFLQTHVISAPTIPAGLIRHANSVKSEPKSQLLLLASLTHQPHRQTAPAPTYFLDIWINAFDLFRPWTEQDLSMQ